MVNRQIHISILLLYGWTFWLGWWIYTHSIADGGLASWDGFERCAWGANIWHDLRHLDYSQFWVHTHEQVVWPFLHSWLTGAYFLLFQPSLASARLISLTAYVLGSVLILARFNLVPRFSSDDKGMCRYDYSLITGGVIAWSLFTCSPLVIQQAAGIMSELLGFVLVFMAITAYEEELLSKRLRVWISACALILLFYYKYNFACLTYAGFFLAVGLKERFRVKRLIAGEYLILFGVPLIGLVLWLLPDFNHKIQGFFGFAFNNPAARTPFSLESLFFYPGQISEYYFPSQWIALLVYIGVAVSFVDRVLKRQSDVLVMCMVVHFAAAVIHPMKDIRFVFIPMCLMFVLASEGWQGLIQDIFKRWTRVSLIVNAILVVIVFIPAIYYQQDVLRKPHVSQSQIHQAPIRTILDRVSKDDRIAFLIAHDIVIPPAVSYYLITNLDTTQRGDQNGKRWDFLYLFHLKEAVESLSDEEKVKQLQYKLFLMQANKIVTIESTAPHKIARYEQLFAGTQQYIEIVPALDDFELIVERDFQTSDLRLKIYESKH